MTNGTGPDGGAREPVVVEELGRDTGDVPAWDGFVLGQPGASPYHLVAMRAVFERALRQRTAYLVARRGREIVGVLPLARLRSFLFGRFLSSLPAFNYAGILAPDPVVAAALLARAVELARAERASHVELRHLVALPLGLRIRTSRVRQVLDLPKSGDAFERTIGFKLRNRVKKARREGLVFEWRGPDALPGFYETFASNMRDLGTPVYARSLFACTLEALRDRVRIAIVRAGETVHAAGVVISFGKTLHLPWAASLHQSRPLCANVLLYFEMAARACDEGFETFDLGRSPLGSGHHGFKAQFGARTLDLPWQYWLAREAGGVPEIAPENPRYGLARRVWRRLPLRVTKVLGPPITRALP